MSEQGEEFDGFVTKYALTAGIEKKRLRHTSEPGMVELVSHYRFIFYHGEGREWHRTWESARKRAEEMRDAKVKSLRKSLDKFKALTFPQEPPP